MKATISKTLILSGLSGGEDVVVRPRDDGKPTMMVIQGQHSIVLDPEAATALGPFLSEWGYGHERPAGKANS